MTKSQPPYLKERLGIMDHIKSGRLIGTAWEVWNWICMTAAKEYNPGCAMLNAPMIAECIHRPVNAVREAMKRLKVARYIYYDGQGKRRPFLIFINKYELPFYSYVNNQNEYIPYFTNLWRSDGEFIGENIFFARYKLRKIRLKSSLKIRFIDIVSKRLNGEFPEFKTVFMAEYEKMSKDIDIYIKNGAVLDAIAELANESPEEFPQSLKVGPYLSNNIFNTYTKVGDKPELSGFQKKLHEEIIEKLKQLTETLKTDIRTEWKEFDTFEFLGFCNKEDVPLRLIDYIALKLLEKVELPNQKPWGYIRSIVKAEKANYHGKVSREDHERHKADLLNLTNAFKGLS